MEPGNYEPNQCELIRATLNQAELVERIGRTITSDGTIEALPGLYLKRSSYPTHRNYVVSDLAFCVIAQGSKEVVLGDTRYKYDPAHYLLATVEMPVVSQVVEASPEQPYLSLRLQLDPNLVSSVIVEAAHSLPRNAANVRAIDVSRLDANLLDATVRLVRLVERPDEARILTPLITREIVYRLLLGEQSERLRHLTILGGQHTRIIRAIERLRREYSQPLSVEGLAQEIGMSVSGFHHHFKTVTAMSPLQFQKQLRLQEARRLMLAENLDAANAGYRVGYDDPSHFSREYKNFFGTPPLRDVQQLRETTGAVLVH